MVTITGAAVNKVQELAQREGHGEVALRLYVSGGGCSGLNYGLAFEDQPDVEDKVVELNGVKILVDSYSAEYVKGAEIDYIDGLMGSGFTIHNPNAVSTCACGQSFQTTGGSGTPRSCH